MKWNIALVLFCILLLTIRYLIIHERFESDQGGQEIRISDLAVKETRTTGFVAQKIVEQVNDSDGKTVESSILQSDAGQKNNVGELHIAMFGSKPFEKEKHEFLPSDKIYISLAFSYLEAGTYDMVTHWKTPKGAVARKIVRKVTLKKNTENYRVHFWFQLVENGLFTEMFTGSRYKKEVYGQWEVIFFMNNEQVGKKNFLVADM